MVLLAAGSLAACVAATHSSDGGSESASATGAAGGATTAESSPSASGTASSGSTGGTNSSGSTGGTITGGSGSSGSSTGSPFPDAGYVFCSSAHADDGGPAAWICPPGTYLCDPANAGNCFQCQGDADCANRSRPTYDPARPHCDLDSGVAGYQNDCQDCVRDADCAGSAGGPFCDLDPSYPPAALQPSIENLGFETCGLIQTDCRLDGGPACDGLNQFCDLATGRCSTRTATCAADADCVGLLASLYNSQPYLLARYCVAGSCNTCPGGVCANVSCYSDSDCGNLTGSDAGLTCVLGTCVCTSSSECGGPWPACEGLDAGQVNMAGEPSGFCSCEQDSDCGDAGLMCLPSSHPYGLPFCGLPCTAPEFPPCSKALNNLDDSAIDYPICNPATGFCESCVTDQQCQAGRETGGPSCTVNGACGCISDGDCPKSESCQPGPVAAICEQTLPRCTPASCGSYFCDWDSGDCRNLLTQISEPSCLTDYDCSHGNGSAPFCEPALGSCVECRSDAECLAHGPTYSTFCCLPGQSSQCGGKIYACVHLCLSNEDCGGNSAGPTCLLDAGMRCGCADDADCVGNPSGRHCDTNPLDDAFGSCFECAGFADCPPGEGCNSETCTSGCGSDADCPTGYFCDPQYTCRARCDNGHTCQGPDPLCDSLNVAGQNGQSISGSTPGNVWCYGCLSAADCDAGLGCETFECGPCNDASQCDPGEVCGFSCEATCDAGPCPTGQVCDTLNAVGKGGDVCYQCVSPADCPGEEGCLYGACGLCRTTPDSLYYGAPSNCPPAAVCSDYWSTNDQPGVCLPNCDVRSCPADRPICATLPALTPDHSYCFGCLSDADCADAGTGTWCDTSVGLTFSCIPLGAAAP